MTTLDGAPGQVDHAEVDPARAAAGLWHTRTLAGELEAAGLAHLPRSGGAVLALTHFAHRELASVELAVWRHTRRRIRGLVLNGRVDEPHAGGLFRPLRRIFVDLRTGADAYSAAFDALRDGDLVALFAETAGDAPVVVRELRISAARLALDADVPLIPVVVCCTGPGRHAGVHPWADRRAPHRIEFGAPIPMQRFEDMRAVTDELRATMQRMLLGLLRSRSSAAARRASPTEGHAIGGSADVAKEVAHGHPADPRPGEHGGG